jgi:hypothetical protein
MILGAESDYSAASGAAAVVNLIMFLALPGSVALLLVIAVRASNRRSAVQHASAVPAAARDEGSAVRGIAPQWAADPFGRHQLRYFDGKVWTSHVSDNSVVSHDDPGQ